MSEERKITYITPFVLDDNPALSLPNEETQIAELSFNFREYAITLARLIASKKTKTPITIAVNGKWGSGKTSLLRATMQMLINSQQAISGKKKAPPVEFANQGEDVTAEFRTCKTVWFNAWKYSNENSLLVALIQAILATMSQENLKSNILSKILDPTKPRYDVLATFVNMFKLRFGDFLEVGLDINKFRTETPLGENIAFFEHFKSAFETLIARWVHGESDFDRIEDDKAVLVIFIDDLDRCLPDKTVQVLEAIKLFMDIPGCVFVIGADTDVIQQSVLKHYSGLPNAEENARDYLDKMIQESFFLPPIERNDVKTFISSKTDAPLKELLEKIWPVLYAASHSNPRKLKLLINQLSLQWAVVCNLHGGQITQRDFFLWQLLITSSPPSFRKKVRTILTETELLYRFIKDAVRWASGDQEHNATYSEYKSDDYEGTFVQVLRTIGEEGGFSEKFSSSQLNTFIYLTPRLLSDKGKEGDDRGDEIGRSYRPPEILKIGEIEFIQIPAGEFIMGTPSGADFWDNLEIPQHSEKIPYDYWISRYPVTRQLWASVYKSTTNPNEHPMTEITWEEAKSFCEIWQKEMMEANMWPQDMTDWQARLPTEEEWEKAARGEYGNVWPWGNTFDPSKCNSKESKLGQTTPVGQYSPVGDSRYGVSDMVGNVWEWTLSRPRSYSEKINLSKEIPNLLSSNETFRIKRGGSFKCRQDIARAAYRMYHHCQMKADDLGFRIVIWKPLLLSDNLV